MKKVDRNAVGVVTPRVVWKRCVRCGSAVEEYELCKGCRESFRSLKGAVHTIGEQAASSARESGLDRVGCGRPGNISTLKPTPGPAHGRGWSEAVRNRGEAAAFRQKNGLGEG